MSTSREPVPVPVGARIRTAWTVVRGRPVAFRLRFLDARLAPADLTRQTSIVGCVFDRTPAADAYRTVDARRAAAGLLPLATGGGVHPQWRVGAEDGSETYIPLAQSKPTRSEAILEDVAGELGKHHRYPSATVARTRLSRVQRTGPRTGLLRRRSPEQWWRYTVEPHVRPIVVAADAPPPPPRTPRQMWARDDTEANTLALDYLRTLNAEAAITDPIDAHTVWLR